MKVECIFRKSGSFFCLASVILTTFFISCKKKDSVIIPEPPVSIADSTYQILGTAKMDINDFDITYQVNPPQGDSFSEIKLHWSTSSSFDVSDSVLLSSTAAGFINGKHSLHRLKQATNYFARLSVIYKGKKFYSSQKTFSTDTLKLLNFPSTLSRDVWSSVKTNFKVATVFNDTSTRVYLNSTSCVLPFTNGEISQFIPPSTLLSGKYALKFERNGIQVEAPDSIEVLRGKWSEIAAPVFPLAPGYMDNGLGFYGSCYSSQKGYIIPGNYFRQIPYGDPNFGRPGYVLEFDGATNQWSKKTAVNPMYFETPICHYANNSIYVLGGWTTDMYNGNTQRILRMLRFDLSSLTWSTLDTLPYSAIFNLVSFAYNNEFYIGMGADLNNTSACCGMPLPSKKFWKYNPSTNLWTQLADFPANHEFNQNNPTAFTIGSKAYVFYGAIPIGDPVNTINFRQELWEYNPASNSWTQLSLPSTDGPPPGEKYQIFSYNNKAYFLTAQKRDAFSYYYGYTIKAPCLEFDPSDNSFKKISSANNLGIMKLIFKAGNKFYFQSDAFGYTENIPNTTHLLTME